MSNTYSKLHYHNLTPLRFFLALFVAIMHINEFSSNRDFPFFKDWSFLHKGTEAVYVFFTLSGFLIIKQLVNEKANSGSISLKSFYKRRILRIFPLYYLILTFGFLYYQLILPKLGFNYESNYNLFTGILLSGTFFSNIFITYSPGGILEILWSLAIEEQFYIVCAPIILLLPIKKVKFFLSIFTVGYFIIFHLEHLHFLQKYNMLFYYFTIGGLCSVILDNRFFLSVINVIRIPVLVSFVLYFTTNIFNSAFNNIYYQLISILLFGLTIAILSQKKIGIIDNKLFNHLGKISYGLYMYHPIAIQIVGFLYLKFFSENKDLFYLKALLINFSVIMLTIVIAHFSFVYYESFFLKRKYKVKK